MSKVLDGVTGFASRSTIDLVIRLAASLYFTYIILSKTASGDLEFRLDSLLGLIVFAATWCYGYFGLGSSIELSRRLYRYVKRK